MVNFNQMTKLDVIKKQLPNLVRVCSTEDGALENLILFFMFETHESDYDLMRDLTRVEVNKDEKGRLWFKHNHEVYFYISDASWYRWVALSELDAGVPGSFSEPM